MTTRHEIKAIPTKYNGIEFRSRLEARWAVFFDTLGIKYLYEYEGYQLPSGWYVPDFYLPDVRDGCFVEIKPIYPTDLECKLCYELCVSTNRCVFLQFGEVDFAKKNERDPRKNNLTICFASELGRLGVGSLWHECPNCSVVEPRLYGEKQNRILRLLTCEHSNDKFESRCFYESIRLRDAFEKAQKTKFW